MGNSKKKKENIILHIDMDYFFAQIEERENPQFKGKPVVVGADPKEGKGRGVVSTCNYEARKFGIKSGMPISRAYKLCPQAIFLPVNMQLYKRVSRAVFQIAQKFSSKMERVSLDEAYIDLTGRVGSYKEARREGEDLRKIVFEKERLTCSIGVSKNKMMAKIACELAKPDGIRIITPVQAAKTIASMKVETIPGIGPKTRQFIEKKLKKKDPQIRDALVFSKSELADFFGKRGEEFYYKLRGIDKSPVEEKKEAKSVGKEHTFQKDTRDAKMIIKVFKRLVGDVHSQVKDKKINGLTVVCRYEDFETHTKQISFDAGKYTEEFLYKKSISLLLKFLTQSNKKIRLIGFRVKIA